MRSGRTQCWRPAANQHGHPARVCKPLRGGEQRRGHPRPCHRPAGSGSDDSRSERGRAHPHRGPSRHGQDEPCAQHCPARRQDVRQDGCGVLARNGARAAHDAPARGRGSGRQPEASDRQALGGRVAARRRRGHDHQRDGYPHRRQPVAVRCGHERQCRRIPNLGLVVIDYLQLMQSAGSGHGWSNESRTQPSPT